MSKVINIVGYSSNVGKTLLIENLIKELKSRGYSIATNGREPLFCCLREEKKEVRSIKILLAVDENTVAG